MAGAQAKPSAIDTLMERASEALAAADYFKVEKLTLDALGKARRAGDYDIMSRIVMPLLESRRQLRHEACDAGIVMVLSSMPRSGKDLAPGMYLVQPPLIGSEAKAIREMSRAAKVPVLIVCREPATKSGQWPIVAVGSGGLTDTLSLRVKVDPPSDPANPDAAWMVAASEAIGDAGIARVKQSDPAAWRAEDLFDALDAAPDHEKLHQHLAEACAQAAREPLPKTPRRRALHDLPHSF